MAMSVDDIGGLLFHDPPPGAGRSVLFPYPMCPPQPLQVLPYPVSYPLTTLTRADHCLLAYPVPTTSLFDVYSGRPDHFGAEYPRGLHRIAPGSRVSDLAGACYCDQGEL